MKKIFISFFIIIINLNIYSQSIVNNILNTIRQDSLVHYLEELTGVLPVNINDTVRTITSRYAYEPGNELASIYIKQKLESYGLNVTDQQYSTTGKNVLAKKIGTQYPNLKYIICTHYDGFTPGADDNGSGTAAVIEAARVLKDYSFPFSIEFDFWDEEENGLVGSEYYVSSLNLSDSILGVINLDMVSYDSNNDGKCDISGRKEIGNALFLREKMNSINYEYSLGLEPFVTNIDVSSDQSSFHVKNIGAIYLTESHSDFNLYYHTLNDKVENINPIYFLKMTKLAIATLVHLSMNYKLSIEHTPIQTTSNVSPYVTKARILSTYMIGNGLSIPRLYYRTKFNDTVYTSFNYITGILENDSLYSFTIPEQQLGTSVQYYLAAQDTSSDIIVTYPEGGRGVNPPGTIPPNSLLEYDIQWDIADNRDYAQIQISTNQGLHWWSLNGKYTKQSATNIQMPNQPIYDSIQSTWVHELVDLTNYKGKEVLIRFFLKTGFYTVRDGLYIDNVKITFMDKTTDIENEVINYSYNLEQNYPNPFNPVTNIKYSISKSDKVSLIIYDVLGREVKTLVDEFKEAGTFNV
ncbi:MAG TPA: M28 family peptidase, partial [Nitrososphaeraceae archaeon]|nr:M28 family peptidase [Nitrososphaeraceae archaeon]